jgi:hypothetical protein
MFVPRFRSKRIVAALLPCCFLWAFVACVSLCTDHAEETGSDTILCLGMDETPASDSCPIVEAPKVTLRERPPLLSADAVAVMPARFNQASVKLGARPLESDARSSTDPPFERLRVLRI